jgi:predicted SnoaL-like aldol condensation-catalyzing enzyme
MDRSRQKELQEYYRTLRYLNANRLALGERKSLHRLRNIDGVRRNEERQNILKSFTRIACNFWIIVILYCSEKTDQSPASRGEAMSNSSPERNKAIVLEAFETLFNKRDYLAAERFWSPNYLQHSAHIAPGREGLFNLVRSVPETLHYENQLIIAEGDYVIAHGRFTGMGRPAAWIAADVIRFEDGLLKEHWDVLEDEGTKAESVSGLPMFGDTFPK